MPTWRHDTGLFSLQTSKPFPLTAYLTSRRLLLEIYRSITYPMAGRPASWALVYGIDEAQEQVMDRRTFATGLLATIGGIGIGLDRVQVPSRVEGAHVRYLQASVDKLYLRDQHIGGATLARDGLRQYYRTRRMLEECDFSEDVGRSLLVASGQLATATGWLAYDAGAQPLARDLYAQAWR